MKIELVDLSDNNRNACFNLKVASDQAQYIASNEESWKEAKANDSVARPFLICCDGKPVGFTMFAFDEDYEDPNDRYWLWRFMIDEASQGKGYGTAALQGIIRFLSLMAQTISAYPPKRAIQPHCRYITRPVFVIPESGTVKRSCYSWIYNSRIAVRTGVQRPVHEDCFISSLFYSSSFCRPGVRVPAAQPRKAKRPHRALPHRRKGALQNNAE